MKYPLEEFGMARFLMVGCGNSKMSEEMGQEGYHFIDNMDISPVVLEILGLYLTSRIKTSVFFRHLVHGLSKLLTIFVIFNIFWRQN